MYYRSLCPKTEEPSCKDYESIVEMPISSCCTTPHCVCDVSKCDAGVTMCASNKHVEVSLVNECCETAKCVCNECCDPEVCKDGWVATEETDDCGCVKRRSNSLKQIFLSVSLNRLSCDTKTFKV